MSPEAEVDVPTRRQARLPDAPVQADRHFIRDDDIQGVRTQAFLLSTYLSGEALSQKARGRGRHPAERRLDAPQNLKGDTPT